MVSGWGSSWGLLLLLVGAAYSRPVKRGFSFSSYGSNPVGWDVASAGRSASDYKPGPGSRPPPGHWGPGAAYVSYVGPDQSGYMRGSVGGSEEQSPSSDAPHRSWAVAPLRPLSAEDTYGSPDSAGLSPPPYQAGELMHMEQLFEDGSYESETEEQGVPPPPPPGVWDSAGPGITGQPQPPFPGSGWAEFPFGYMVLTGQYPPGTVTHFTSSFEHGRDHWQDSHYLRDHRPSGPRWQQPETFPADPKAPEQPRHHMHQDVWAPASAQPAAIGPYAQSRPFRPSMGPPVGSGRKKVGY